MPSRFATAAIILFWLAMTGWLIEREVVPMMIAEDSPSYQVNLTDEIGSPIVNWTVLRDGKRIGSGTSSIHAHDDRTHEFRSNFNFDGFEVLGFAVRRLESNYRVTGKGRLEALSAKFAFGLAGEKG